MREKGTNSWHKLAPVSYKHIPPGLFHTFLEPLAHSWHPLRDASCGLSLLTQMLILAAPWGTDLGQRRLPTWVFCGIPHYCLPNTNTTTCALSHSPKTWCLLMLLCSQGIDFLAGFTTPSTLNSDKNQYRKTRNPKCLMNIVSWVTFSLFLPKVSVPVPLPLPHISQSLSGDWK